MVDQVDLSKVEIPPRMDLLEERSYDKTYLRNMIADLEEIRKNTTDIVVKGPKVSVEPGWNLVVDVPSEGLKIYEPTSWTQGQVLTKLHIPRIYHDHLLKEGREDMLDYNINELMHMQELMMVRTVGKKARALVSPGFLPVDNLKLFSQVANSVRDTNMQRPETQKPAQFWKADVNDHRLYLHILDEGREFDVGKSAKFSPMVIIKNSEVGDGSLSIEPGFYNWQCQNRHIMNALYTRAHRGVKLEEGTYAEDTRETADLLLRKQVRDWMYNTLHEDKVFEAEAKALRESIEVKFDNVQEAVHRIADANKLTVAEETDIINAMMGDQTLQPEERNSLYAIIQGMTFAEKKMGADRGYEVAKIASDVPALIKAVA